MASKITTLFEDSAKTNALYPRTKVSAISDNNDVALSALLDAKTNASDPIFTITKDENGNTLTNSISFTIVAKV